MLFNSKIQSKNMKKFFWIGTAMLLTTAILYSCTKNSATVITTEEQAVDQLVRSGSFVDFSKNFIPDVMSLMNYHRTIKIQKKEQDFLSQVNLAKDDESQLANTYHAFSLSYDNALLLKNKIDNDLLMLFNKAPFLLHFDDNQVQSIIVKALETGKSSPDPVWIQAKKEIDEKLGGTQINIATQAIRTNLVDTGTGQPGLTWDEVWDCVKRALGLGSAGILSIAGLKKLAKEGIQEIVITMSKFLAKHAGWFGLAIAVIDLSSCLYHEYHD
jgi:hypothetical protein